MAEIIQKALTVSLLLIILLTVLEFSVSAAPQGTSEAATVKAAKDCIGVKNVHGGNSRTGIDCLT